MYDLWDMSDAELAGRKLFRFRHTAHCACGLEHVWQGANQRWYDQHGLVVVPISPVNPPRPMGE